MAVFAICTRCETGFGAESKELMFDKIELHYETYHEDDKTSSKGFKFCNQETAERGY